MGENIKGYESIEVIRLVVGSPGYWFPFTSRSDSVLIDNLGSNGVYFNFNNAANTGSTNGYVPALSLRSFDIRTGSVSIYPEAGSNSIQIIKLGDS